MARIPLQIAERRLDTGGVVNYPQGGGPIGAAMQDFGANVQQLGSIYAAQQADLAERQKRKDLFKDEIAYKKFEMGLEQDYALRVDQMPVDGAGFHDDFFANAYKPKRDAFLSSLKTPEAKERFAEILGDDGLDATRWSIRAGQQERDQTYKWYSDQLVQSAEQRASVIDLNPEEYDRLLQEGNAEIDNSPLPAIAKQAQKQAWEKFARVASINAKLRTDPNGVLLDMRADPRMLGATTQFSLLKQAVIHQESGGRAGVVSNKGAIGLMQIMPETAREIARELGDSGFNQGWKTDEIVDYMRNPYINERYGDHYLRKMVKMFAAEGGLEAALVGYNGGPKRARAWIDSGFNDNAIPEESANYYKTIMARLPGMTRGGEGGPASAMGGNPNAVTFTFAPNYVRNARMYGSDPTERGLHPQVVGRVKQAFAQLGIDNVKVTSGHRSSVHNKAAGGAARSQHVEHTAIDIDVEGYSVAERRSMIRMLSANGITGLGIGKNIIHADIGPRRSWGYNNPAGGGEPPSAYRDLTAAHDRGPLTADGQGLSGRYAGIGYKERQEFIGAAEQRVAELATLQKPTAVQTVEMRQLIANEITSLTTSGVSTGLVNDEDIVNVLGEDDYLKFQESKEDASSIYMATKDMKGMTEDELIAYEANFIPTPGDPNSRRADLVHDRVRKEHDRIKSLRANHPNQAALEFEDVKEAERAAAQPNAPPAATQEYIRRTIARQLDFGLKPDQVEPIALSDAMDIGRRFLAPLPELSATTKKTEVDAKLLATYLKLREQFGDYTDDIILYSLREYHAVGARTGAVLKDYMQAISSGQDIMGNIQRRIDKAAEQDRIGSISSEEPGWTDVFSWGPGKWARELVTGEPAAEPTEKPVSDEEAIRRSQAEDEE